MTEKTKNKEENGISFREYFESFLKMQEFIINDLIRATIWARANFLVAMGIFNYIEILGSFCLPDGNCKERFNFVFENELLPKEYKNFYNKLKMITDPYHCLRCGMVHEYLIKTYLKEGKPSITISFTIYGVESYEEYERNIFSKKCGLELIVWEKDKSYHINVYNPRLIHDLNLAFENFKQKINEDMFYRENFLKRAKEIRLEKLK